jgi:hypothetical protein
MGLLRYTKGRTPINLTDFMPYKDPEKERVNARERKAKYAAAHPGRLLSASRKYNEDNKEKRREQARRYYHANREVSMERNRKYWEAHPEKKLEYKEKRVTRRKLVPRESVIENHLRDRVLSLGGLCIKFVDPGQRGAPDRLVVLPGMDTLYVELKRPHLGVLDEAQKRYHSRLRTRGQRVWVLWSKEDVDAFIAEVTLT